MVAVKAMSVLLVWHGNTVISTTVMDPDTCYQAAQELSASGFPSTCVAKSCIDLIATSKPGGQVECDGKGNKAIPVASKKTPGVM